MRRLLAFLLLACAAAASDPDTDGDGLADFAELHKYRTDPAKKDSDGDGKPDGDWDERREYSYSILLLMRVMKPAMAVGDDYQDARVVKEGERDVTLEIVCYPLTTAAEAVEGCRDWRAEASGLAEWLRPGLTSNWDEDLKSKIVAGLGADGIDVEGSDDRALATKAAAWLTRHASYSDSHFTAFFTEFVDGRPRIMPGLEETVRGYAKTGLSFEEQWRRDLFAKSMFEAGERGSCTSSAIYLAGCLRAIGLPTRILYCIPPADASDAAQVALVRDRVTHRGVRRTLLAALGRMGGSWSSHTINEVFVGGRWRRLNYERLGQPPLDENYCGMLIPILALHDWADAGIAANEGKRQALGERDELFPHVNPYVALEVSDLFGVHAKVENDPVEELKKLTIVKAFWYADRQPGLDMRNLDDTSGHLFVQVKEEGGLGDYRPFYDVVDKEFVLRNEGHADVLARAERGYWGSGVFYLRIEPEALARMAADAPYALVPRNRSEECRWTVADGVALTRTDEFRALTIDRIIWSDSKELPKEMREGFGDRLMLLVHVKEWDGFEKMKRFTASADPDFLLEADGHAPVRLAAGTGGITNADGSTRFVVLMVRAGEPARGVAYTLRAMNAKPPYEWKLALSVTR